MAAASATAVEEKSLADAAVYDDHSVQIDLEMERKVRWKQDMRIIPLSASIYFLCYLDRSNIGNAKIDGLIDDLNLTGNKYNIALVSIQTFVCHDDRSYFADNVFCRAFTTCGFPDVFLNSV